MSPTSNSSPWGYSQNRGPASCGPDRLESSRTTNPAAPDFDWTSASVPTRLAFSRSAPPPSSEITDASTSQPIERAGTRARMNF